MAYPTNGFVFSGAAKAHYYREEALEMWLFARLALRWFDDRDKHRARMKEARKAWRLFRHWKHISEANGYRWRNV